MKNISKALFSKKMMSVFLLGVSSGLPIMVLFGSIKLWLKRYDVDISTIGYTSLIVLPYSYNFLWAFVFDRFSPIKKLGRRRGWLLITQVLLMGSFFLLSFGNPNESILYIMIIGIILCFFSASQDVAVDAYRNEILSEKELGLGASVGVYGYRLGMWIASGFGVWIADKETWNWSFNQTFILLGCFVLIGIFATLWSDEPETNSRPLKTLKESVVLPFLDFFKRDSSILILLFIFFYKLGDSFSGSMTRPFYADIGFSNKDIGAIASSVGLFSTMLGLFVGGALLFRFHYYVTLWTAGIMQAISTALFAFLAFYPTHLNFAGVVFFEDLSSGIGTAALVAFMGKLTNKNFTATQYALLASIASSGRSIFSIPAGNVISFFNQTDFISHSNSGYILFFIFGSLLSIPGLILLAKLNVKK
jgi:PAT family beta-lactamase induction signal transducer AmpG